MSVRVVWESVILVGALVVGVALWQRASQRAPAPPDYLGEWSAPDSIGHRFQRQAVLLYFGDVNCRTCTSPRFQAELTQLLEWFEAASRERGVVPYTIGVVISPVGVPATDYVRDLWSWVEIVVGGSWINHHVLEHLWESGIEPVTPTVVLYTRAVHYAANRYFVAERTRPVPLVGHLSIRSMSEAKLRQVIAPSSELEVSSALRP